MAEKSTVSLPPSASLDTPTDHRSFLNVIGWLFAIISLLVVATRCGTRWAVSRSFGLDDAFIIASLLLAIGSMVAVTIGIRSGLGLLDWESGSQSQLDGLQKLAVLYDEYQTGEPFLSWLFILSTLLAQCLGIVSACILYLKPFLQSLNSGMIRNDDLRRRGGETSFGSSYKRYASKTKIISKKKISDLLSTVTDNSLSSTNTKNETFPSTLRGIPLKDHPMRDNLRNDHQVSVVAEPGVNEWEASSQSSQSSQLNMIRQTKIFSATSTHEQA
ncbi:hypothetical protein OCU04_002311 [Sclerotinia nivalis]|uniref:Uncharacterized protein n=1 Tax=Sclerotinia nivalis TaxID=352851 RepID=A0A9X0AUB1_9HELO|nr:hypothetical protein OCU04_002311 [Sclerotinia nivalis]